MVITNDELNLLPKEVFSGVIETIDTIDQAKEACSILLKSELVGFDTETKPSFKKGIQHELSLVQLSLDNVCFLFRINKLGSIPQELIDVFNSRATKLVGLSLKDDFDKIRRIASVKPENFIDIQGIIEQYNIEEKSLRKIYALLFQKRISKGQRLSNWDADRLSPAQQMYAAIDAWACLRIYKKLMK